MVSHFIVCFIACRYDEIVFYDVLVQTQWNILQQRIIRKQDGDKWSKQ